MAIEDFIKTNNPKLTNVGAIRIVLLLPMSFPPSCHSRSVSNEDCMPLVNGEPLSVSVAIPDLSRLHVCKRRSSPHRGGDDQ